MTSRAPLLSGLFCTEPVCSEGCNLTQGYCKYPGECRCRQGWTGERCDQCVPAQGCDHGYCSLPGECHCNQGWRGELCDQPDCGDGCDPDNGYCSVPGSEMKRDFKECKC